jgi:hypothetical protein
MKNLKTFEGLFSEPHDDIVDYLIQKVKDGEYEDIYGPYNGKGGYDIYSAKIDDKKLEVVFKDTIFEEYETWFGNKKLISSNRKNKKLYRLLSIKAVEN